MNVSVYRAPFRFLLDFMIQFLHIVVSIAVGCSGLFQSLMSADGIES
jgi:hypothetical protein